MYYIIKKEYVGPNWDQGKWVDYDTIVIGEMEDYARGEGFTIAGWENLIKEELEDYIEDAKES